MFEEYENPFLEKGHNWWGSKSLLLNNDLRNVKSPSQSQSTIINCQTNRKNHTVRQKNQITTLKGMAVARSWDENLDTVHSLSMKIRPHPIIIIWRKIRSSTTNLFYCLELTEKQLLQAFNVNAVILDGCCLHASSRVDNVRYYQLLASSRSNKNFLRLCNHCVWFILCWLNYRMPKELTVFGICIWNIAWIMIIKTTFRFLSHQEIKFWLPAINLSLFNAITIIIESSCDLVY